jgi:hypothetical protein
LLVLAAHAATRVRGRWCITTTRRTSRWDRCSTCPRPEK